MRTIFRKWISKMKNIPFFISMAPQSVPEVRGVSETRLTAELSMEYIGVLVRGMTLYSNGLA